MLRRHLMLYRRLYTMVQLESTHGATYARPDAIPSVLWYQRVQQMRSGRGWRLVGSRRLHRLSGKSYNLLLSLMSVFIFRRPASFVAQSLAMHARTLCTSAHLHSTLLFSIEEHFNALNPIFTVILHNPDCLQHAIFIDLFYDWQSRCHHRWC
jgi:hypothetical protein